VLAGEPATERLREARPFGSGRTSHRIGLSSPGDVDGEVRAWLRDAFDRAGG
jgi:hypothetical protein